MLNTTQHQKVRGVSIWFYVIAAFQMFAAYQAWSHSNGDALLAQAAMVFVVIDVAIALAFVVLGYFAGKREPWAFVVGLFLYAIRAVLQFFQFFSPISLIIRAFLLFRMYQGLQACLQLKQAEALMKVQAASRMTAVTPQMAPATASSVAWSPSRPATNMQSDSQN